MCPIEGVELEYIASYALPGPGITLATVVNNTRKIGVVQDNGSMQVNGRGK